MKAPDANRAARGVLLIEDTRSLQLIYRVLLQAAGHETQVAGSAAQGMVAFRKGHFAAVVLDLGLPDRDGLDLIREMLAERPKSRIIVITANGSISKAVEAMRAGAHDFLVKPFEESRLLAAVRNALSRSAPGAALGGRPLAEPDLPLHAHRPFLGTSAVMQQIQTRIEQVARSMATVFITGESGTGKELCALAVHGSSARANGPFIALNCGAIPHDLLESEVFGHVKGSFTGAIADRAGAATAADGGTLFLDEICEMAPALQTKLLRFLQTSTVLPVGATKPQKVDVRIICATNRDPLEAVRRGQFREDLYYRLFVVGIHMPPLRERDEDAVEIAESALIQFAQEEGRWFDGLSPEVARLFRRLPWPGNVRQLLNVIRNVVVLNPGGVVTPDMLPADLVAQADGAPGPASPDAAATAAATVAPEPAALSNLLGRPLAEAERIIVMETLALQGGSVPRAARVLDLSPSTLYRKLEAWAKLPS